jgi:hypothetical protein
MDGMEKDSVLGWNETLKGDSYSEKVLCGRAIIRFNRIAKELCHRFNLLAPFCLCHIFPTYGCL